MASLAVMHPTSKTNSDDQCAVEDVESKEETSGELPLPDSNHCKGKVETLYMEAFEWQTKRFKLAHSPVEQDNQRHHVAIVGMVSCGKSTLLNRLVGSDVAATGVGRTTTDMTPYDCGGGVVWWDVPGRDDRGLYFTPAYFGLFKALRHRVILVQHTFDEMAHVCQLWDAVAKPYIVVVNRIQIAGQTETSEQRDKFETQIRKEVSHHDKSDKKSPGRAKTEVLFISAANPQLYAEDWRRLQTLLKA